MPTTPSWQLPIPLNAVVFDCDGTLSTIEGIDELAKQNHAGREVQELTNVAMSQTGIDTELYRKRLQLVLPSQEQVDNLGLTYYANCSPDAAAVIACFQRLNKEIYIMSAGLAPAVVKLGELLNIPRSHVLAVDIQFDEKGRYLDFDTASPFATFDGKRKVIAELQAQHHRIAHIGDGMNDFVARDLSTRFVGYGGNFYRENIAAGCEFYIKTPSLASLLPLLLTQQELQELLPEEAALFHQGVAAIDDGMVKMH